MMNLDTLTEYLKIHLISIKQDRVNTDYQFTANECYELNGQIKAVEHILEVIDER